MRNMMRSVGTCRISGFNRRVRSPTQCSLLKMQAAAKELIKKKLATLVPRFGIEQARKRVRLTQNSLRD